MQTYHISINLVCTFVIYEWWVRIRKHNYYCYYSVISAVTCYHLMSCAISDLHKLDHWASGRAMAFLGNIKQPKVTAKCHMWHFEPPNIASLPALLSLCLKLTSQIQRAKGHSILNLTAAANSHFGLYMSGVLLNVPMPFVLGVPTTVFLTSNNDQLLMPPWLSCVEGHSVFI